MTGQRAELAALLRLARAVLAERGWAQGCAAYRRTGAVDLVAALAVASGAEPDAELDDLAFEAVCLLATRLVPGAGDLVGRVTPVDRLRGWNDVPRRTVDEVLAALLAAAEDVERQAGIVGGCLCTDDAGALVYVHADSAPAGALCPARAVTELVARFARWAPVHWPPAVNR